MAYVPAAMTEEQLEEFLSAPRHAVVATNRADGPPQLSPVWYLYDEGRIYISFSAGSAKHRNLRRDPRIGVCVDAGHPDARAVMLYGRAELIEKEEPWAQEKEWQITCRYFDSDEDARRYLAGFSEDAASVLAVITLERIVSQDFN